MANGRRKEFTRYLAYCVRCNQQTTRTATEYAEALSVVGSAADSLSSRRRPWEIELHDFSLPEWQERVRKLLCQAMPHLDARLQELAGRTFRSLEDQLYDPDPDVDGYDKEGQRQYLVGLLHDLASEIAGLVLANQPALSSEDVKEEGP